jgi:NAD(P)-dependent dehydrogenase (short-subunit alcohol dehydrogenase family)
MGIVGGTSAASVLRQQGGVAAQALKGKVALVTGGNSGAGFETVKVLALAGARVIVAGRRPEAVQTAVSCIQAELKKSETGGTVEALPTPCDLESLASVRAYAAALLVHMGDATPLHFLVLNAGVMFQPFRRSPQGLEVTWSVNHLYIYLSIYTYVSYIHTYIRIYTQTRTRATHATHAT